MPAYSNCTNTLQSVIIFATTQTDLVPLSNIGGYTNEPAISICNDALSDLLTSPNDWKCNQHDMTMLVTAQNKQDYLFAGASAFTLGATSSGAAIDLASNFGITVSGGVVTVTTLEPHRFKLGDIIFVVGVMMTTGNTTAYNSAYFDDGTQSGWTSGWPITAVTTNSFSFAASTGQNNGDTGGAPGITDFGWLASASLVELNSTSSPQNSVPIQAVKELQPWSKVANPQKVCVYSDLGNGVLKIRFWYVPGSTIWGALLVYQGKAPVKTDMSDTWAPFPDNMSAIYRQAVLYRCYRHINSPRADVEYQKLQAQIAKMQGFDDAEDSDVHMVPAEGSLDGGSYWGGW